MKIINEGQLLKEFQNNNSTSNIKCPFCGGSVIFSIDKTSPKTISVSGECLECKLSTIHLNINKVFHVIPGTPIDTSLYYGYLHTKWLLKYYQLSN